MNKKKRFIELYKQNSEPLERYALNLTRNRIDAEELCAETIAIAYSNFSKIKEEVAFLSYLFTIARRLFFKNKNKFKHNQNEFDPDIISTSEEHIENKVDIIFLYQQLDKLDEVTKDVIILAEIFGFKHKEIAEIHNLTVDNVKVKIHRGKEKLKELLNVKEDKNG